MYWKTELPIIVRSLINDWEDVPSYSNDRIIQLCTVSAQYVLLDVNLTREYEVDIVNKCISPDPSDLQNKDSDFIGFIALKAACILDQSTFRDKAKSEGIRTSLGSAKLDVSGSLSGYKTILEKGPCYTYSHLVQQYNVGNASVLQAILSPFVGNKFDPQTLNTGSSDYRRSDNIAT